MNTTSILEPLIDKFLNTMLSTLLSIFKEVLPIYLLYIAVQVVFRLIKRLFTPKYDGIFFDDDYAFEFDLLYDSLRHLYYSDDDFINDYMSDFTAFQDDGPSLDELFEEYSDDDSYDSYLDYVEHSELE